MTGKLSFADLEAMYTLGGYSISAELSNSSALMAHVALTLLQQEWVWIDYELDIQDIIAKAIYELTSGGSPPVSDFVKLGEVTYTADTTEIELTDLDLDDYTRIEIYASGLLSNYDGAWVDGLLININEDATSSKYWSYNRRWYGSAAVSYEHRQSEPGWLIKYGLMADTPTDGFFSNLKMTIFNPHVAEFTHMEYSAMNGNTAVSKQQNFIGSGMANVTGPFDAIRLIPEGGARFLIDPASADEPDEARLTVYGLG